MKKLVAILLLFFVCAAQAQNPDYEMVLFNKMDGLGQDYVYSLIQDKRNFLWVGTGNGLARYNGRTLENFTTSDSISDNFVTASASDVSGNLIFGHFSGGLTRYDGNSFSKIAVEGVDKKIVGLATSQTNGITWAITQGGIILKLEGTHVEIIRKSVLDDKVINCFEVVSNRLLIGTNEGLIAIDLYPDGELSEGKMPEVLQWVNVTAIHVTSGGSVWVGTEDAGVYKSQHFERLELEAKELDERIAKYSISALLEDSNGNLWVGTKRNGTHLVRQYDSILGHQLFDGNTGYPNFIQSIYEDREGSIWLGTIGEGLVQIVKNQFTHYNFKQLFAVSNIASGVMISKDQYLYFTDKGVFKGVYNYYSGKFEFQKHADENLASLVVNFMFYDGVNTLWLTTENGVAYTYGLNDQHLQTLKLPIEGKIKFRSVDIDGNHNTWVSVASHGVFKLDENNNVLQTLNTTTGFIHNDIFAIHVDLSSNVWFGAKAAGLAVMRADGNIERLTQQEVFPSRDINDIKGDHDGNVWISTDGNGLFEFNGDEFIQFDTSHGLYSMYCGNMVLDMDNNIWVTHRDGISSIRQDQLNKISTYSQSKGIFGVNTYYHTLFSDAAGGVWFGSGHELIRYNTSTQFKSDKVDPFITDLRFYYQKEDLMQYTDEDDSKGLLPNNIRLPHNQNHITFDFIAVSLKKRNSIYYKHRLMGYEKQWSPPSTENSATYTNLAPGEYTLLVASSDNQYVWSEDTIQYSFSIIKPYWERWWFYGTQILFFSMLILITFRVSKKNSKDSEKNKWVLRIMVYVCLFIMFEYLQNFMEPYTENYVGGAPVFKILINLVLALVLFPVEGLIKAFFYSNEKKLSSK